MSTGSSYKLGLSNTGSNTGCLFERYSGMNQSIFSDTTYATLGNVLMGTVEQNTQYLV